MAKKRRNEKKKYENMKKKKYENMKKKKYGRHSSQILCFPYENVGSTGLA
jgi:hypothetical protein